MHEIDVAGTTLILTPQRAAVWPARCTLLVADAHFGKAASFRARGVPVPEETTQANLDALDALIAAHAPTRIVFLGDFMHAREAHAPATIASLRRWRAHHHALHLVLIAGNHDAHAGAPPADLGFECVQEPFLDAPFALCHHPAPITDKYVLAGHLHPAYRLSGRSDSVRLPCFWLGRSVGVLPAFGDFTGARTINPQAGDCIYVIAGDRVHGVPGWCAA